ncbi:MAG: hypothetical protein WC884_02410 [Candidatus Paceibacterota bacterium]
MAVLKKKKVSKKKVVVKKKIKIVKRKTVTKKKAVKKIIKKLSSLSLKRSNKNPIIEPESSLYWESKATFNPSAIYHDGKIHIIYRAIGNSDISVLGYTKSNDGYSFEKQLKEMAYYHKERKAVEVLDKKSVSKIMYSSGGGWSGGCEDPRLTLLGDNVYMLYTAFDGWGSVRIALTSISLNDFINRHWNWKEPVLISPIGQIHKNWVLFPEKINGKYAILHSISPHIMINYFKSLDELDGSNFIHSVHQDSLLWSTRDRLIRGVGPAPIKTKYGWLVLYHKMERHDTHRYKLWAMILDTKDPKKILYNSKSPILEPDLWYENEGYKSGVVYSCGAVVKDGQLFVYYGGADKVSCVATADLDKFLKELINSKALVLKKDKIKIKA